MSDAGPTPTRLRRRRVLRVLLWSAALVIALLLGVSVYVQRPSFRARVVAAVNDALAGSGRGRVTISDLTQLGLSSARLDHLEVSDEHGATVLALDGIRIHYTLLGLLAPWLPGPGATVTLGPIRVEHTRARFALDPATGEPTIVRALSKERKTPPGGDHTALAFALSAIELGEVDVDIDHPALGRHALRLDHVHGSTRIGGDDTRVSVERFGVQLVEGGQRTLVGTGSFTLDGAGVASGGFHGFVRGTELDAAFQLDAGVLAARVDIPHALPERVRDIVPGWPLLRPIAARLTAHGPLGALAFAGQASFDETRIELTGSADLDHALSIHVDARGHAIDLRAVSPSAPATAIEARGQLEVSRSESGVLLVADVTTDPTTIASLQVPKIAASLRSDGPGATAHIELGDQRGQLAIDAQRAVDGGIDLTAHLTRAPLEAWPELGGKLRGELDLRVRGRLDEAAFRGELEGRLSRVTAGPVAVPAAQLRGSFSGSMAALADAAFDVSLKGDDVDVGPLHLEHARIEGRGTRASPRVSAEFSAGDGSGTASARLDLRDGVRVADLVSSWSDRDVQLSARVAEWRPESGLLDIERLTLSGKAGSLEGKAMLAPGRTELSIEAERLDTEQLARRFGVSGGYRGTLTGQIALQTSAAEARGELNLHADKLSVSNVTYNSLDAHVKLAEEHVDVQLDALDPALGHLTLEGALELDGRPLQLRAWKRATGSASMSLEQLPLWPVGLVLSGRSSVKSLDGRLDVKAHVERHDPAVLPDILVDCKTRELSFELAPEAGAAPRVFDSYVLEASASLDGHSGRGAATLRVTDEHGALVTTSGAIELDLQTLSSDPHGIADRLLRTPLDVLMRLHPRPVSLLPAPFGASDLAGNVEATLQLRGSLAEPTLSLAARAYQLQGGLAGVDRAVDVTGVVEYVPNSGKLEAIADVVQAGQSVIIARAEGQVPSPFGKPPPGLAGIELRAAAMLNGAPLDLLPAAARERIEARLYGSIDVEKEPGGAMRERAHLEIANLSAQGQPLGNGRLTFEGGPSGVRADLRVGSRDHYLRADVRDASATGGASGAFAGSLLAHDFDAASLSPLTSGLLTRLAGALNADLAFKLQRAGADWYLGIDGKANLTGGSAHIEELGLEVRDIAAAVIARSTPEYTVLQIDPLSAKARSRNANVKGDAEIWLRGLRVMNGEANLTLDDVPLSLKGVSRGIARGHTRARLERKPDYLALEVKIPDLRVRLPASSTRTLIELDPNAEWRIAQAIEEAEEQPHDALLWKIQLELGDRVHIERGDLDVPLTGHPTLEFQYALRPSGTIEALPGGRIMLFNQNFTIDRGLVQFVPDEPDNPRVDVTASWRAPDGTTVYVDVTGRAKDATVLTRDDRGLQEVERFYLITGGATEGRELSDGSSAESGALGQTFSLGINELLRNSLGNVAVSVGTTADDRASYSASVRLSDKLSFQGSFQPASESNLEESTNDLTGTLDYRITRSWSLRTELGTSGGAFDLLWSHRY